MENNYDKGMMDGYNGDEFDRPGCSECDNTGLMDCGCECPYCDEFDKPECLECRELQPPKGVHYNTEVLFNICPKCNDDYEEYDEMENDDD